MGKDASPSSFKSYNTKNVLGSWPSSIEQGNITVTRNDKNLDVYLHVKSYKIETLKSLDTTNVVKDEATYCVNSFFNLPFVKTWWQVTETQLELYIMKLQEGENESNHSLQFKVLSNYRIHI